MWAPTYHTFNGDPGLQPSYSSVEWMPQTNPSTYSFSNSWETNNTTGLTHSMMNASSQSVPSNYLPSATDFVQVSGNYGWETRPTPPPSKKTPPSKKSPPLSSSIEEEISGQNLYKTELCRSYEDTGSCRYGTKCQFAHGRAELRPVLRHPKYKTEICKTFYNVGTCPYGRRCRFIHSTPADVASNTASSTSKNSTFGLTSQPHRSTPPVSPPHVVDPISLQNSADGYSSSSTWTAPSSPLPTTETEDSDSPSWIEAMGSLTISPASELVQLIVPEPSKTESHSEAEKRGGRLSFFESITGGQ